METPAPQAVTVPDEADAVFEGGGVKGVALAGAVAASEDAGVRVWKNVAGTSAGAIVACLIAVGYDGKSLRKILDDVVYNRFADYGPLGKVQGWVWNQFRMRGLAPGSFFSRWLADRIGESPLARELGKDELTFADVARPRDDFPPEITEQAFERARYRLRVIGSEVSSGRMLVLPQDIEGYCRKDRNPYEPDTLTLVEAVRMSMSYPFLYTPHVLYKMIEGEKKPRPYYVVDGGLLSNFPVWLFDRRDGKDPVRPTWAFRLHGGEGDEPAEPYKGVGMPLWRLALAKAMLSAATGAWDEQNVSAATSVRTINIPTFEIRTTDFNLTRENGERLYRSGVESTNRFFARPETRDYLKKFQKAAT